MNIERFTQIGEIILSWQLAMILYYAIKLILNWCASLEF